MVASITHNSKIKFSNIRRLKSNISVVHQHLQTSRHDILALTETQMTPISNTTLLLYPGYELHGKFRFKNRLFTHNTLYFSNDKNTSKLMMIFIYVLWLKVKVFSTTKFLCYLHMSFNNQPFNNLLNKLSSKVDPIQIRFPNTEVVILGEFNVHNSN